MNRASLRPLLSLFVVGSTLLTAGCDEPNSRCEGRDIYYCTTANTDGLFTLPCEWRKGETCSDFCVESNGEGFCSLTKDFAPNCPPWRGEDDNGSIGYLESHCEDDTVVLCRDGYLIEKKPCDAFCVEPVDAIGIDAAICANEPEPNPACDEVISGCIDGMVTSCVHGFAVGTSEICPEGSTCTLEPPSKYSRPSAYCGHI